MSYMNPKKGDVVYVEWGDNYHSYDFETVVSGNKKKDKLIFYNSKWFVRMGEGKKCTYVPLTRIDANALVRKI